MRLRCALLASLALCASCAAPTLMKPEVPAEEKVDVLKAVRQLVDQLTTVVGDQMASPPIRVAQSWSSEYLDSRAQAQTFLILSLTAASVHDQTVVEEFLVHARALFLGWQRLCQRSKHQQQTCQVVTDGGGPHPYTCGTDWSWRYERFPCLPHRRWDKVARHAETAGSAADADADAILAMIVLVSRFEGKNRGWWQEMGQWAFDSCKAFLKYNTKLSADTTGRVVRLGSCRGGWECTSPSFASPAHFRVFRQFMLDFVDDFGGEVHKVSASKAMRNHAHIEADAIALKWDELISTSYRVLGAAQSNTTGLFVNWVELSDTSDLRSGAISRHFRLHFHEAVPARYLDLIWHMTGQVTAVSMGDVFVLEAPCAIDLRFADEVQQDLEILFGLARKPNDKG